MEKDRPNQFTSPWQTFAILMAVVFIAEAFVMYLIHPFEDRLGHLFILTVDASLLLIFIAPLLWWFIANPLRSTVMIAHDLRSPLTSVVSTAAMMEDGLFGPVGEEQQRWLVKMQTMCRSLVDLVSDFLDLSKIEAGHVNLQKESVDFNQLIRNNVEAYRPLASKKRIAVIEQVAPNLPAVEADPRRLDQILQNLISNAIKFTPEGGKIEVGAGQEDGTEIKLWVKDTGAGIPPEELGPLFQKYRQTTSGKTSKDKGTGLGLVICKMIVEAHGGRIEVESAPGKGSTFTVRLPVNRQ